MSTKLYVTLFGGASYSWPDDAERFASLADARAQWLDYRDCPYSNGTPCWGDAPAMALDENGAWYAGFAYYHDDDEGEFSPDAYPDYALRIGPRGGATWERC